VTDWKYKLNQFPEETWDPIRTQKTAYVSYLLNVLHKTQKTSGFGSVLKSSFLLDEICTERRTTLPDIRCSPADMQEAILVNWTYSWSVGEEKLQ